MKSTITMLLMAALLFASCKKENEICEVMDQDNQTEEQCFSEQTLLINGVDSNAHELYIQLDANDVLGIIQFDVYIEWGVAPNYIIWSSYNTDYDGVGEIEPDNESLDYNINGNNYGLDDSYENKITVLYIDSTHICGDIELKALNGDIINYQFIEQL